MTLRTLTFDDAQYKLAPVEAADEMLATVIEFPESLVAKREAMGDVDYRSRMEAATLVDRAAAASQYRELLAAVPDTLPGVIEHSGEPVYVVIGWTVGFDFYPDKETALRNVRNLYITPKPVYQMLEGHPAPAQPVADTSADARDAMIVMVDAAMEEMKNISPPLRRSECERLIRAAIAASREAR